MHRSDKPRLRHELLAVRASLSDEDIAAAREAITAHVLALSELRGWRCVAGYVPVRAEPASVQLLTGLVHQGARVIVPLTLPDNDLDWALWDPQDPIAPMASADHPARPALGPDALRSADAVLLPALAVARGSGARLGRGGGSYDRALRRAHPDAELVALVYDEEVVDELPTDEWDRPVGSAVCPSGWVELAPPPGLDGNAAISDHV